MNNSNLLISVQNVGVRFRVNKSLFSRKFFQAIKEVSFNLYKGESVGIIGRNGAGKSTILRLLGGIIRPNAGKIINYNVSTALLALQVGFDPELSGRVNILLSGMLLGFQKKNVEAQVEKIISFSELGDFIDQPVKSYSTGMRARLGFAIALELSPDVLLIDEVLGVGDVEFSKKSMRVMRKKLLSDQTIVIVSHNANTIKKFCDRAVWIEDGVSLMEGNAVDVVDAYEEFVTGRSKKTA